MSEAENPVNPVEDPISEGEAGERVETDLEGLYTLVQKLTEEREGLLDQVSRAQADFRNLRNRTEAEKKTASRFASEKLATDLLPVLDNFERTVMHLQNGATVEAMQGGISAVEKQLRSVLEGQGIRRIEAVGQPFDTDRHEALGFEENAEIEEGTVSGEIEPGYTMHDKVIRPARVRLAKRPA